MSPFKKSETGNKVSAKVFVNRNEIKENFLKNYFGSIVGIVNGWIIPLMKQFNIEVTFDNITDYIGEDIKSLFIDTLIIRKENGAFVPPTKHKQMYAETEKDFEKALLEVITNSPKIKGMKQSNEQATKDYESKIKECRAILAEDDYVGNKARKEKAQTDLALYNNLFLKVTSTGIENIKHEIECEKENFANTKVEVNRLKGQKGWFNLTDDELSFNEEVIIKASAVYADTPQEIALLDKLKQLAALTNEIYGNEYPGALAGFCTFFITDKGKVVLKSDITKDALVKYAKNM